MRIGVISDTHVPVRARVLPGEVFEIFAGVDLILHAGDLVTLDVLDELETIAPVVAVHGNVDRPEVLERLPATRRIEVWSHGLVKVDGQVLVAPGPHKKRQSSVSLAGEPQPRSRAPDLGLSPGPGDLGPGGRGSGLAPGSDPRGRARADRGSDGPGSLDPGPPIIIGLVHGHGGTGPTTPERAASHFPDANIVVFGHSHQPMNEWHDGRLLFNPGSARDPRRVPGGSVGILQAGRILWSQVVWLDDDR